jgi:hypothetical protein
MALLGLLLLAGGQAIDWTNDDLKALRIALSDASDNGRQGVQLRMGSNLYLWGIQVNGKEVVSHWTFGHPLLSPRGYLSGARAFMSLWYYFDYGRVGYHGEFRPAYPH